MMVLGIGVGIAGWMHGSSKGDAVVSPLPGPTIATQPEPMTKSENDMVMRELQKCSRRLKENGDFLAECTAKERELGALARETNLTPAQSIRLDLLLAERDSYIRIAEQKNKEIEADGARIKELKLKYAGRPVLKE